jgi:ketosteroid isomerase-like protein
MTTEDAGAVARAFVERVNAHDVPGITALLADDHRFVDATGAVLVGRETVGGGWRAFLDLFPDYRIEVERVLEAGEVASLFGSASGTCVPARAAPDAEPWLVPAAWLAVARGGVVAEWRVYAHVEPMLRTLSAHEPSA